MPVFAFLLLLPLVEIALFVAVAGWIGLWLTLGLVVAAGMAGAWLLREQGLRTAAQLRLAMDSLADPTLPMAHGAILLVAGILLVIPGFLSDAAALLLLLPPVRRALLSRLARGVAARSGAFRRPRGGFARQPDIIEGDFREIGSGDGEDTTQGGRQDGGRGSGPPSGWTRH